LNAIAVLSLIRDIRAREAIVAQLLDRDWHLRAAAARALALLPCPECVPALERVLRTDPRQEVRVAAVQSLIGLFDTGFEDAIREVIAQLFDPSADDRLRRAALAVVPLIRGRERRALLKKLQTDPDEQIAHEAREIAEAPERDELQDARAMASMLRQLGSPRPGRWNEALHRLTGFGSAVIDPLVARMVKKNRDPQYCARAGMVLRGLGPRRLRPIARYLECVDEPLPLEVIVEVVGGLQDKPLIYRLKDLIERLDTTGADPEDSPTGDPFERVRANAHFQLARIGSRVAISDLKDWLNAPRRRLDLALVEAVGLIGTRDELQDLLRAYKKEEPWMRERIRDVFMRIMRRERIRRTNRLFGSLSAKDRQVLERILGPPRRRPRTSPPDLIVGPRAPSRRASRGGRGVSARSGH
jgi:HEAT repeat protein